MVHGVNRSSLYLSFAKSTRRDSCLNYTAFGQESVGSMLGTLFLNTLKIHNLFMLNPNMLETEEKMFSKRV